VLPISTLRPLRLVSTSPGRKARPEIAFSAAGTITRSLSFRPLSMIMEARPRTLAAPPMSFFISAMPLAGLMSRPPVSKTMPLPTSVTFGSASDPQRMSMRQGGRSLPAPTACSIGKPCRSASPSMTVIPAPKRAESADAARARSCGERSLAGVLMRSRARKTPSRITSIAAASAPAGGTSRAEPPLGVR
jgi:hypothetical protein